MTATASTSPKATQKEGTQARVVTKRPSPSQIVAAVMHVGPAEQASEQPRFDQDELRHPARNHLGQPVLDGAPSARAGRSALAEHPHGSDRPADGRGPEQDLADHRRPNCSVEADPTVSSRRSAAAGSPSPWAGASGINACRAGPSSSAPVLPVGRPRGRSGPGRRVPRIAQTVPRGALSAPCR